MSHITSTKTFNVELTHIYHVTVKAFSEEEATVRAMSEYCDNDFWSADTKAIPPDSAEKQRVSIFLRFSDEVGQRDAHIKHYRRVRRAVGLTEEEWHANDEVMSEYRRSGY